VLVLNTYLQDASIFCDHSGIWNLMMIDKFTTDTLNELKLQFVV